MFVFKIFFRQLWIHIHILSLLMISLNAAPRNKSAVGTDMKQLSTPRSVNSTGKGIGPSSNLQKTTVSSVPKIDSADLPIKFQTKVPMAVRTTTTTMTTSGPGFRGGIGSDPDQGCKDKIGGTLCNTIDNYPTEDITRILKNATIAFAFKKFFLNDSIGDEVRTKFDDAFDTSQPLCSTKENTYSPRGALNKYSQLKAIVQGDGQFSQIIRVETCMNEGKPCRLVDRPGYETKCVQKYILRKLVYFTDEKELEIGDFSIPSCCSCRFTETENPVSRAGLLTSSICPLPNTGSSSKNTKESN